MDRLNGPRRSLTVESINSTRKIRMIPTDSLAEHQQQRTAKSALKRLFILIQKSYGKKNAMMVSMRYVQILMA